MKKLLFLLFAILALKPLCADEMTPDKALKMLVDGNKRFSQDLSAYPDRTAERRKETAAKQMPFACIVGCSDSRVAPEILFDQGIGDLFIVRVAGNVVGPVELDSIEYSVVYLKSSLIVVLGHQNCGAVDAVLNNNTKDIEAVAELIAPAIKMAAKQPGDKLVNAIKSNVNQVVEQLNKSPVLRRYIEQNKLAVKGGYYNFQTGQVELL